MQPISRDRLLQIKFDKSYSNHSIAAKVIEEILAEAWSSDSTLNDAAEYLRGWNLATDAGNRHAALGVLTTMSHVTHSLTGKTPDSPPESFKNAVRLLMDRAAIEADASARYRPGQSSY